MKTISKTRNAFLAALMVLATAAFGLQPLVINSEAACGCEATASSDLEQSAAAKISIATCCCNPQAVTCQCGDCECGDDKESKAPTPAIPINETNEVVSPTLICAVPFVGFPSESEIKLTRFSGTVTESSVLSSQQTCVLLSRFTC